MTADDVESSEPCRLTLLTPQARGAIATIAVNGTKAIELVEQFFQPLGHRFLSQVSDGTILVGHWRSTQEHVEEVVVARRDARCIEINCHGGVAASEAIIAALTSAGAYQENVERWLDRHTDNPIQKAAWHAISLARTERTAGILLDQFQGALTQEVQEAIGSLRADPPQFDKVNERLTRLLQLGEVGLHLSAPWRVVLAGPPNVGKSSLFNAILGYERSIVFDQAGTTRDVLSATTALDGWLIELSDTAGHRDSTDLLEIEGTRRAWQQLQRADLAVIVADATDFDLVQVNRIREATPRSLVVVNKVDLCNPPRDLPFHWLSTSAVTGLGVSELAQQIVQNLVPNIPDLGEAVPFTPEQLELLRDAQTAIESRDLSQALGLLSRIL